MTEIESPCIRNCCLDGDDICVGCFRSVDEIMQWSQASDQRKQEIVVLAHQRKEAHQLKYGCYLGSDKNKPHNH